MKVRGLVLRLLQLLFLGGVHSVTVVSLERLQGRVILRPLTLGLDSLVCLTFTSPIH